MATSIIPTIKATTDPTTGNTINNGYPLGQHWFNTTTGEEFIHKTDGVWVVFSESTHTHSQYLTGYTETNPGVYTSGQTDTLLAGKSNTGHTHNNYLSLSGGTLTGDITGTSITVNTIKTITGTSTQYLMADGSTSSVMAQ